MIKEIDFTPKPKKRKPNLSKEVQASVQRLVAEPTKRISCDIPESLHTRIKVQLALEGLHLSKVVRDFFEERFPDTSRAVDPPPSNSIFDRPPEN